jgi:hypothetical protein
MRQRAANGDGPKHLGPAPVWTPIDYTAPLEPYTSELVFFPNYPRTAGVYLLEEAGRYYIGQSVDVVARVASHRFYPSACTFENPRGVILAAIQPKASLTWNENGRIRLHAEARFIAAGLVVLGAALTNKLSPYTRAKLAATFTDLTAERSRISEAVKILC